MRASHSSKSFQACPHEEVTYVPALSPVSIKKVFHVHVSFGRDGTAYVFSASFILLSHTGLWGGEVNAAHIVGVLCIDVLRVRRWAGTGLGQRRHVKTAHNQTYRWDSHGMLLEGDCLSARLYARLSAMSKATRSSV